MLCCKTVQELFSIVYKALGPVNTVYSLNLYSRSIKANTLHDNTVTIQKVSALSYCCLTELSYRVNNINAKGSRATTKCCCQRYHTYSHTFIYIPFTLYLCSGLTHAGFSRGSWYHLACPWPTRKSSVLCTISTDSELYTGQPSITER